MQVRMTQNDYMNHIPLAVHVVYRTGASQYKRSP